VAVTPLLEQHLTPKRQVSFSKTSVIRKQCPPKAFGVATALRDASDDGPFTVHAPYFVKFPNKSAQFAAFSALVYLFTYTQKKVRLLCPTELGN
jgi:hypothetical protein